MSMASLDPEREEFSGSITRFQGTLYHIPSHLVVPPLCSLAPMVLTRKMCFLALSRHKALDGSLPRQNSESPKLQIILNQKFSLREHKVNWKSSLQNPWNRMNEIQKPEYSSHWKENWCSLLYTIWTLRKNSRKTWPQKNVCEERF